MKNNLTTPFIALLFLSLYSCEDILVEEPKSLVVESFYNTPAEVEAGIAAIYSPLRNRFSGWWMALLENQTEYGGGTTGSANFDSNRLMQGLSSTGIGNVTSNWDALYQSIRNANIIIAYVPNSELLTQEQKDRFIGEAKFLRAFTYFNIVKAWGGVPLHTEENLQEVSSIPKASKEQVYQLIVNDLQFAEANLLDVPPNLGRPSKWAAKTVLADVHLYLENYAEAMNLANEVIQSGKFALEVVTQADDFNKIFGPSPTSSEEIFYFRYNNNSSSSLITFTMPINADPWFNGTSYGIFFIPQEHVMYRNWDDVDLRKEFNWYQSTDNRLQPGDPWFASDSEVILSPKKYNDPGATVATNPFPAYRFADILLIFSEASAREAGGATAGSMEALNKIRRRAYGYNPLQGSPVDLKIGDFPDLEGFIDRVVKERGYEFQFEAKRWFDLVRTGRVNSVILENTGRNVAEKHLLWPIPPIEFDLNDGLNPEDQNPGY